MKARALVLLLAFLLLACDDAAKQPYLEITGGGFVFNYRLAVAYYLLLAAPKRVPPEGTVFEAVFEDPAGGPPILIRVPYSAGRHVYRFETPPVQGIVAGRDYDVRLRVLAADGGKLLAEYAKPYHATLDQSVLPAAPLTSGPAYFPPPGAPAN